VEFCYFENTGNGDSEAISVKSRENTLRYNTFRNNQNAMMVFRNGNDNVAYGNFFINAGGIRVKEANNIFCYNNYFQNAGVGGTMNAVTYDFITGNLKNINFLHNTFVECGLISLSSGATNNTWANNIFKKSSGNIFSGSSSGISWTGNLYQGTLGVSFPSGMTNTDPKLALNSENYYGLSPLSPINNSSSSYPAVLDIPNIDDDPSLSLDISGQSRPLTKTEKDAGCDEFTTGSTTNHPLVLSEVGPSYLGGPGGIIKQDQVITFTTISSKVYGNPDFNPGATASSGLPVSYASSNTAVATIVNGNIHITGIGTSTITASQSGNVYYNPAIDVSQTLTVAAPNKFNYVSSSNTILSGTLRSGSFGNLSSNDASYLTLNSTTSGTRKTDWYGSTFISQTPSSVTKLTVNYDGKNSASKTQVLYLYNWGTAAWTQIDSRAVSTADVLITSIQNSPSIFISDLGEIRLRIYSAGGTKNYTSSGDWIQFTVETNSAPGNTVSPYSVWQEKKQPEFVVYPNPVSKNFSVQYRLSKQENVELSILSMSGQKQRILIYNQLQKSGDHKRTFDISDLAEGVYIIKLTLGNIQTNARIVVVK
jgi:hypothetical protein